MKFRRKDLVDAIRFNGTNAKDIYKFLGIDPTDRLSVICSRLEIDTPDGVIKLDMFDYLIKETTVKYVPCKRDIFEQRYEFIEEVNGD